MIKGEPLFYPAFAYWFKMSISEILSSYRNFRFSEYLSGIGAEDVEDVINRERPAPEDIFALLSERALEYLEPMAKRAAEITRRYFGNVISIFTPMYISNLCDNSCPYCSFSRGRNILRRQLAPAEIRRECERISEDGIRHILVLTGGSRRTTPVGYIKQSISIIAEYFSSIGIEIYALSGQEYKEMVSIGVDSLTIYQEVYNREIYRELHFGGPKEDYTFRLEAADRACKSGIRAVTVGSLLGLNGFVEEAFYTAVHLQYLQKTYPDVELSLSFPRLRPAVESFTPKSVVSERELVQIIAAFRIIFPSVGITLSTRESESFRNGVLPLGVTRMSAGVSTSVGGHSDAGSQPQFEIADTRSVKTVCKDLLDRGFQPVMHDWHHRLSRSCPA